MHFLWLEYLTVTHKFDFRSQNRRAMGWTAEESGFDSGQGVKILLPSTESRLALGSTHLPIQLVLGALFLRIERSEPETWIHTSIPFSLISWSSINLNTETVVPHFTATCIVCHTPIVGLGGVNYVYLFVPRM
jgi:hypothetical protein